MAAAQDHRVETAKGAIFARSWRPEGLRPEAPSLVMFHDSLGSVALWRDLPEALAERTGLRVVAYDRPGFGLSDAHPGELAPDFVAAEAQESLPALFEALQILRFVAFGHSVGGGMAVSAGAAHPEACAAVVTIAAQAFVEDRTLAGIRVAETQFAEPGQVERLARHHGEKARWVLDAWIGTWTSAEFADWSLEPALRRLKAPLLAIHGDQDEYGSLEHPRRLAAFAGGEAEKKIMEGCAHTPHRERPEEVLALAAEFLKRKGISA